MPVSASSASTFGSAAPTTMEGAMTFGTWVLFAVGIVAGLALMRALSR